MILAKKMCKPFSNLKTIFNKLYIQAYAFLSYDPLDIQSIAHIFLWRYFYTTYKPKNGQTCFFFLYKKMKQK